MRSESQRNQSRVNGSRSKGPLDTSRSRFNSLKHGLRAEQVVLPGEDPAAFDAELQGWLDDWRPPTHTRALLCERGAAAAWKLRRATRTEAAKLHELAQAADDDIERRAELIDDAMRRLHREPDAALFYLRCGPFGLEFLAGLWESLAAAASEPSGWASRHDHHDRLLALLGHPAGSEPDVEVARASLTLLSAREPGAAADPSELASACATIRAACAGQLEEIGRGLSRYDAPAVRRQRFIDCASAPVTKEAVLMHRYEMAHENALFRAIRQLLALTKSGADLAGPAPEPVRAAVEAPPASAEPPAAAVGPEDDYPSHSSEACSDASGSLGAGVSGSLGAGVSGTVPARPAAPKRGPEAPSRGPRAPGAGRSPR